MVSGDSLWSIARRYNITVNKLKDINNLKSDLLSVGMKLLVSKGVGSNISSKQYVAKKEDLLYKIANNNGTTVTELIIYIFYQLLI